MDGQDEQDRNLPGTSVVGVPRSEGRMPSLRILVDHGERDGRLPSVAGRSCPELRLRGFARFCGDTKGEEFRSEMKSS